MGPAGLDSFGDTSSDVEASAHHGQNVDLLLLDINESVRSLACLPRGQILQHDESLVDIGLDSVSMVELRQKLQHIFREVPMPASVVYDHPSVRALAEHFAQE